MGAMVVSILTNRTAGGPGHRLLLSVIVHGTPGTSPTAYPWVFTFGRCIWWIFQYALAVLGLCVVLNHPGVILGTSPSLGGDPLG